MNVRCGRTLARVTVLVRLAEGPAVELKGGLVVIPSSNGGVLARLPFLPVTLILKHWLLSTIGNGPLLRALESALGMLQARTVFVDVRGALLAAAGPSPSGLPGTTIPTDIPLLMVVSLDVPEFMIALALRLAGIDGTGEHGVTSTARGIRAASEKCISVVVTVGEFIWRILSFLVHFYSSTPCGYGGPQPIRFEIVMPISEDHDVAVMLNGKTFHGVG
ncbi:hypothetical protein DFS33DRAFT_1326242 [Desarmillaria ectypa]|nr:hypothetical protein DFS33DRAFT_1326242 [Desarmillaria ectypa]